MKHVRSFVIFAVTPCTGSSGSRKGIDEFYLHLGGSVTILSIRLGERNSAIHAVCRFFALLLVQGSKINRPEWEFDSCRTVTSGWVERLESWSCGFINLPVRMCFRAVGREGTHYWPHWVVESSSYLGGDPKAPNHAGSHCDLAPALQS